MSSTPGNIQKDINRLKGAQEINIVWDLVLHEADFYITMMGKGVNPYVKDIEREGLCAVSALEVAPVVNPNGGQSDS